MSSIATALGPTVLVILGGILSWVLKNRKEELQEINKQMQMKREQIYLEALKPYIAMFTAKGEGLSRGVEKAKSIIKGDKYWKNQIDLCLYAPDNVVKTFNALLEYTYSSDSQLPNGGYISMGKYARLLIEIRKALGNKKTKLEPLDMLIGSIKDARKEREKLGI